MVKKALHFVVYLLPLALIAGIFLGIWQLDVLPIDKITHLLQECGSRKNFILLTILQTIINATFFGFFGHILANKIGLWKPIKFEKEKLKITFCISVFGGILFFSIL